MIKEGNLVPIIVVAASLFAGLGLMTAFAVDSPRGAAMTTDASDSTLNDKIETLLRTDIGLAGSQFKVQTTAGIVTLGGRVADEQSLRRALDLTSSVKGVRDIRNGMVVEAPK